MDKIQFSDFRMSFNKFLAAKLNQAHMNSYITKLALDSRPAIPYNM